MSSIANTAKVIVHSLIKNHWGEPGFQSGPGDSVDADYMAPCLLVTKSSPPSGGAQKKNEVTKDIVI